MSDAAANGREPPEELDEEFVAGKAWDAGLLRRLIGEARGHGRLFAGTFAILAVLMALEIAGPWILRSAIDGPVSAALAARQQGGDGFDPRMVIEADAADGDALRAFLAQLVARTGAFALPDEEAALGAGRRVFASLDDYQREVLRVG